MNWSSKLQAVGTEAIVQTMISRQSGVFAAGDYESYYESAREAIESLQGPFTLVNVIDTQNAK